MPPSETSSESIPYRASLFLNLSGPSAVYLAIYPGHSHARVVSAFEEHHLTRGHHAAFTTVTRGTTTKTNSTTTSTSSTTTAIRYPPYRSTRFPQRSDRSSKSYRRSSRPIFPNPAPDYELDPDASYFSDPSHPSALIVPDTDGIAERVLHDKHRRLYNDTVHCLLGSETAIPDFYHRAQFAVFKMSVDERLLDEDVLAAVQRFGEGVGLPCPIAADFCEGFLGTLTNGKADILDWTLFEWSESETDPSLLSGNWDVSVVNRIAQGPRTESQRDVYVVAEIEKFLDRHYDIFGNDSDPQMTWANVPDEETRNAALEVFRSLGSREDVWEQWEGSQNVKGFMDVWGWVLETRNRLGPCWQGAVVYR
ncbi:hypothetical protein B0H65DRAFT_443225 [Neurospora tetraspora]|uniref:Uncharacterized protein n=1 Tax=Neurospora tetraspora TaxID=94610 RepID=A0AAE0MQ39_9PEZI|nr:hypothetical protein B0H65DRAFT_443225 [Neurospora tetraspora]